MTQDQIVEIAIEAGWKDLRNFDSEMQEFLVMGSFENLKTFANLVVAHKCEELARKIEKMPFGDTAASFAAWIRAEHDVISLASNPAGLNPKFRDRIGLMPIEECRKIWGEKP